MIAVGKQLLNYYYFLIHFDTVLIIKDISNTLVIIKDLFFKRLWKIWILGEFNEILTAKAGQPHPPPPSTPIPPHPPCFLFFFSFFFNSFQSYSIFQKLQKNLFITCVKAATPTTFKLEKLKKNSKKGDFLCNVFQNLRPTSSSIYSTQNLIGMKFLTHLRVEFSHFKEKSFKQNFN